MGIANAKFAVFCRFVSFSLSFLLFASFVNAQVRINGKVTNATTGEAIAGGTVAIKGTTIATSTNQDGVYSLNANLRQGTTTLLFTGIGMKATEQTIQIGSDAVYTLNAQVEEDVLGMDEVVVTGTGVATNKRQLGNSIATVSGRELMKGGATSIDQALQGKVAGAQITQNSGNPAGGITVRLRGPSTIVGSSDPLYIIDGVIVNNDSRQLIDLGGYAQNRLVDLNPNDIERIEIIKGAAAAAIYGSRANNGVVQIFTKKGVEGKPQFNFSTQVRSSSLRKKMEWNQYPFRFRNFNASDTSRIPVQRYDFQDMIFRNAFGTENNLSVSGGGSGTRYYVSVSNLYNQGIVRGSDFMRNGIRLNLNQKLGRITNLAVSSFYSYSNSNEMPNGGLNEAYGALTGFIFGNNYVNPAKDPNTGLYPSVNDGNPSVQRTNPLEAINRFKFKQSTGRTVTSATLTVKPITGLNIEFTSGLDNYSQIGTAYIPPVNTTPGYNGGFSRRADANVLQLNNDLTVSYQNEIAKELQSTTTLGGTMQYERVNSFGANAVTLGPFGETINNGTVTPSEYRGERSVMGAFLQQTFGFKNRYYLTGAGRVDGSSVYGNDNRWQFYPKLSASYIVSNEPFWSGIKDVVSSFKLRAAYGRSGNMTAIGYYDKFTNYGPIPYAAMPGYVSPSQLGNLTVRPERQTEKEIGFDMGLINDKVSVEFSYFDKSVYDLINLINLAPSSGYLTRYANIGNMSNKGFDLLVRASVINTKDWKWVSSLSLLHSKNKVYDLPATLTFPGGFGQVAAVNGYPLGAYYASFFARNDDGSLLLTPTGFPQREKGKQGPNGTYTVGRTNGQPSGDNIVKVIGQPNPTEVVSFINEVDYKRFNFRMQWEGMYGQDVFNFTRRVGERDFYGGLKGYEGEIRGDVPKGTSAALFGIFENYIEDGSFTKLRELSLAYTLPLKQSRSLRLTLSGRNLLSIDNYSGWDPEVNAAGQENAVRGFDFVEVPLPRIIMFGVNFNF